MLSTKNFQNIVKHTNLFAFDLLVENEENKFLLAKRNNFPAKGFYFVPGGRVYKNERLRGAFERILHLELGLVPSDFQSIFQKGLYEHLYERSFFEDKNYSAHYIIYALELKLKNNKIIKLDSQHSNYKFFSLDEIASDDTIHKYSKNYFISGPDNVFSL